MKKKEGAGYSWHHWLFMLLLMAVLPLVYTDAVLDPVLVPRMIFLSIVLIPWLLYLLSKVIHQKINLEILNSTIFRIYLGFVLLSGVSIIKSINPGDGIWEWMKACTFFIFFVSTVLLFQQAKKPETTIFRFIALFSAIILLPGIYQLAEILQQGTFDHQSSYFITSVFAHRNIFAQALFYTVPLLGMLIYFNKGIWRILGLIFLVLSLALITILMVKSVWLALLVSVLFTMPLLFIFRKKLGIGISQLKKILVFIFIAVLIVIASIAIFSRFNTTEVFKKQGQAMQDFSYGSALERIHLWEKSLEMFKDNPIVGIGLSNWKIELPNYGTSDMRSAEGEIIYQRPHNDFLWILAERGILTLIFYLLIFAITAWYLIRIIAKSKNRDDQYFALFAWFFLVGYGIFASMSFPLERPISSALLNLVFAFVLIKYQKIESKNQKPKKSMIVLFLTLGLIILIVTSYIGVQRFKGEYHTRKGLVLREQQKWQPMIDEMHQASSFFYTLDPTSTPVKWCSGLGYYNLGEMDRAFADLSDAYHANPYHIHVLNNLATIYGIQKKDTEAIELYKEAMRISSDFSDAAANLSVMYFNIGNSDTAYQIIRNNKIVAQHVNYKTITVTIIYDIIEKMKTNIDDRDMLIAIDRIRNSNEWMLKVHEQSVHDDVPLRKQIIIETVYLMSAIDQSIDSSRTDYLNKKYLDRFKELN